MDPGNSNIVVEITDASEFHCFRLVLNPASAPGQRVEIMLHARSLVDLIHKCSLALCEWQAQTTSYLIEQKLLMLMAPPVAQAASESSEKA